MSRDMYVDALKGLAILLVVIAHAIQRSLPDYSTNIYWNLINAFHMPLFMFLSGYILYTNKRIRNITWIKRKFQHLVVPFFAWIIIFYYASNFSFTGLRPYTDFSGTLIDYSIRVIVSPGNGLWFLLVLFYFYVIMAGAAMSGRPYLFGLCVFLTLSIFTIIHFNYFGLPLVRKYIIFFISGYILSMHRDDLKLELNIVSRKLYAGLPLVSSSYAHHVVDYAAAFMAPRYFLWVLG